MAARPELEHRADQKLQLRRQLPHQRCRAGSGREQRAQQIHALHDLLVFVAAAQIAERCFHADGAAGLDQIAALHAHRPEADPEPSVVFDFDVEHAEHPLQRAHGVPKACTAARGDQIRLQLRHAKAGLFDPGDDIRERDALLVITNLRALGRVDDRGALHAVQIQNRAVERRHAGAHSISSIFRLISRMCGPSGTCQKREESVLFPFLMF